MRKSTKYQSASSNVTPLGSVVPKQLVEDTTKALSKLKVALGGDVSGYVACRLHMNITELNDALAAEQVDGVALAMYNILSPEKSVAQAFLDEMPCSPRLDSIRKCIQDYIDGKTDIIHSADKW